MCNGVHVALKSPHTLVLLFDHFAEFQQSDRIPLADAVPMILVDAEKFEYEHHCVVFLDSMATAPLFNGALKRAVVIRRLHGWPFRGRWLRAIAAPGLNLAVRKIAVAT